MAKKVSPLQLDRSKNKSSCTLSFTIIVLYYVVHYTAIKNWFLNYIYFFIKIFFLFLELILLSSEIILLFQQNAETS